MHSKKIPRCNALHSKEVQRFTLQGRHVASCLLWNVNSNAFEHRPTLRYIFRMEADKECRWLLVGSTQRCGRLGVYDYCRVHRMRLRKIADHHSPVPCRSCGVGTQSETGLCKPCGAAQVKKQLVRAEAKARRLFSLLMSELHVRSSWAKKLPAFVGL